MTDACTLPKTTSNESKQTVSKIGDITSSGNVSDILSNGENKKSR